MVLNENPELFSLIYSDSPCLSEDTLLIFYKNCVVLRAQPTQRLPQRSEVEALLNGQEPYQALTYRDRRYYVAVLPDAPALGDALTPENVRAFRSLDGDDAFLLNAANHLRQWYSSHRFCGACGHATVPAPIERAMLCPVCGTIAYPTICPAVTTAITDGDRILLAQNVYGDYRHYSLIAGYVEVGESAEQAVVREIHEEVGLNVKNVRYIGTQPWGMSQTLMIGFHAELDGSDAVTLQKEELASAQWFRRDELDPHMNLSSLSYELIDRFRRGVLA